MALCTSDGNQRSFVRDRIERRAAERISHSARCEPRPHLGSIFFFLSTLCVGERAAARPERQRTLSLLSFNDSKVFLYLLFFFFFVLPALWLCLFLPPPPLSHYFSISLSLFRSFPSYFPPQLYVQTHKSLILPLAYAEFYDLPRYIYALSKWKAYLHNWKRVRQRRATIYKLSTV